MALSPEQESRFRIATAVEYGELTSGELYVLSSLVLAAGQPHIDNTRGESVFDLYRKLDELFYSTRERP